MKCLNCNAEFKSQREGAKFCSAKCRLQYHRKAEIELSVSNETDKPNETDKLSVSSKPIETDKMVYTLVENETVYQRPAVIYLAEKDGVKNSQGAEWKTRPEPEKPDDKPNKDSRCLFKRKNGSEYLIDCLGNICEWN